MIGRKTSSMAQTAAKEHSGPNTAMQTVWPVAQGLQNIESTLHTIIATLVVDVAKVVMGAKFGARLKQRGAGV